MYTPTTPGNARTSSIPVIAPTVRGGGVMKWIAAAPLAGGAEVHGSSCPVAHPPRRVCDAPEDVVEMRFEPRPPAQLRHPKTHPVGGETRAE
jgi:hypothetical protein